MKQPKAQLGVLNQFMSETRASIRSLETQTGKLATLIKNRAQINLPSTTEVNPKDQCNAISLRSKKVTDEPTQKVISIEKVFDKENKVSGSKVNEKLEKKQLETSIDHHIKIPYPQRFQMNKCDKQFSKFLDIFQKLHTKVSKKRKLEDHEIVALTKVCNTILQKKLPSKLKDPGMSVDIGRIIALQIHSALFTQNVGLYFPSLITSLCQKAGVEFDETKELLTHLIYDIVQIKKKKIVGSASVASAGGTSSQARPRHTCPSSLEERKSRLELNF
ncbi:uncharacterized protein LOC133814698 [Humulus lupulus]|uniref:uncharacterized protein LOC133814698 n=1 Tax=Humulus lupulus TaxID=3486 RepID=UPI002B4128E0|nr:uncharacterized protein LOC133814698 [Humulus lupulus]